MRNQPVRERTLREVVESIPTPHRARTEFNDMERVIRMARAEAVTMVARLTEPYSENQQAIVDACDDILERVKSQ